MHSIRAALQRPDSGRVPRAKLDRAASADVRCAIGAGCRGSHPHAIETAAVMRLEDYSLTSLKLSTHLPVPPAPVPSVAEYARSLRVTRKRYLPIGAKFAISCAIAVVWAFLSYQPKNLSYPTQFA